MGHPNAARGRDDNGAADTIRSFADIRRNEAGSTHRRPLFDDDPPKLGNAACNEQCSERTGYRSGGGVFLHSNRIEEASVGSAGIPARPPADTPQRHQRPGRVGRLRPNCSTLEVSSGDYYLDQE